MKRLNLGCGNDPFLGVEDVNHDLIEHRPEISVVWDLNRLPWPWEDCSFDFIAARSVFEHLQHDLVVSLNECWRILRPDGELFIKLPHWQSDVSHQDPTHRWFFSLRSLDQFDPDTERGQQYAFYTPRKWKITQPAQLNGAQSSLLAVMRVRK